MCFVLHVLSKTVSLLPEGYRVYVTSCQAEEKVGDVGGGKWLRGKFSKLVSESFQKSTFMFYETE